MTTDLERAYKIANALKLETVGEHRKNLHRRGILFRIDKMFVVSDSYLEEGILLYKSPSYRDFESDEEDLFLPLEALKCLVEK